MSTDNKVQILEQEVAELRLALRAKEQELLRSKREINTTEDNNAYSDFFTKLEVEKYCRQIILPQIGIQGQHKIKNSKILIVGAGGLGCPAALYLCAAGIGTLGLVDSDIVSISNLHRQILYGEADLDQPKVDTACSKLSSISSNVKFNPINEKLTRLNCANIFMDYDVVLDCTDNVPTRYLVNDVCMLLNKPLVAGNAIRFEGQLIVCIPKITPCYRCLFPVPPEVECIGSCNEDGVVGAVPGVIGVLQALETIKLISCNFETNVFEKITLFEGEHGRFRHMNIRSPRSDCVVCSDVASVTLDDLPNYEKWCGMASEERKSNYPPKIIIPEDQRITVEKLVDMQKINTAHVILDVRSENEYEMCHLPKSVNCSLRDICSKSKRDTLINNIIESNEAKGSDEHLPVFVLCRCGNDSQKAVKILRDHYTGNKMQFFDLAGGLYSWNAKVDTKFPIY